MWIVLRCVFHVSVGIYIDIAWMFGKCIMGYEYFIYMLVREYTYISHVSVGIYIHIAWMFGKCIIVYEYFIA